MPPVFAPGAAIRGNDANSAIELDATGGSTSVLVATASTPVNYLLPDAPSVCTLLNTESNAQINGTHTYTTPVLANVDAPTNGQLVLGSTSTTIQLGNTARVGINTTTPTAELHVVGSANITNTLNVPTIGATSIQASTYTFPAGTVNTTPTYSGGNAAQIAVHWQVVGTAAYIQVPGFTITPNASTLVYMDITLPGYTLADREWSTYVYIHTGSLLIGRFNLTSQRLYFYPDLNQTNSFDSTLSGSYIYSLSFWCPLAPPA